MQDFRLRGFVVWFWLALGALSVGPWGFGFGGLVFVFEVSRLFGLWRGFGLGFRS